MVSQDTTGQPAAENEVAKEGPPEATEAAQQNADAYEFMFQTTPETKECDWHEFKNRYPGEQGWCAIDALLSSRDLDAEMAFEQLDRKSKDKQRAKPRNTLAVTADPQIGHPEIQRLERVRVNSAFILAYLAKVTGEHSWNRKPHTFLSPFKTFIHYHAKMKDEFEALRRRYESQDQQIRNNIQSSLDLPAPEESEATASRVPTTGKSLSKSEGSEGSANVDHYTSINTDIGSLKAYQDMACYMDFMHTRLIPLYTMFENTDWRSPPKVLYSDLWYLFRHGELLIGGHNAQSSELSESKGKSSDEIESSDLDSNVPSATATQFWRLYYCGNENKLEWQVDDLVDKPSGKVHQRKLVDDKLERVCLLNAYYIDYNGEAFEGVARYRSVGWYEGVKDVTRLPMYPIRFVKGYEEMLQRLKARGAKFQSLVSQSHPTMSYMGLTLTHDPLRRRLNHPEYIDSDVVVDFREAYQANPDWKPTFFMLNYTTPAQSTHDEFGIVEWTDRGRSKQSGKRHEMVVHPDGIDERILVEIADSGGFLRIADGAMLDDSSFQAARQDLSPEDLALLPPRMFVYSLRNRKFIHADIRSLQPIKRQKSSFQKLKIPPAHKAMIQSVVWEHFEKKKAQEQGRVRKLEISDQDFIRGKGRGLIILLHGAPGVGKTATAEAVAEVYKKPLFSITCGDLGIEPKEVEKNLSEIFRLANIWQCILLLDEAEIFLSPREKKDDNLQRNALVSIFLRILEYYPGILFLTTNRPGALDEAVKSRVHVTLLYPQLNRDDTVSLFRMNIDRLRTIDKERVAITEESEMVIEENSIIDFAEQHFDKFSHNTAKDCRWNGRQIRNAFQIASSLARYEHFIATQEAESGETSRGLYLGARHFKQVEKATVEYDDFRNKMLGATDSELALHKMERGPEVVRRPAPHQGAFEDYQSVSSPPLQRGLHSMSAMPFARDRGSARAGLGQRGGGSRPPQGFDPNYNTPRQQGSRGSPAYDRYADDNIGLGWEDNGAEPGSQRHHGAQENDEAGYPDTY